MGKKSLLALLPFLAGCVIFTSDSQDVQTEIDEHRALWDVAAITDYSMRFQNLCFNCPAESLIPVRITVRDDTIDTVTDLESGATITEFAAGVFPTIDVLFDFIQNAIDNAASQIDIRYDAVLGYPTDIDIDPSRSFFNDDSRFEIREFQELN